MFRGYKILLVALFLIPFSGKPQTHYWVGFSDKGNSEYSISNPSVFLSERAIERRLKQGIAIDGLDLPVNKSYIDSVLALEAKLVHSSKWLNGITVVSENDNFSGQVTKYSFVNEIQVAKRVLEGEKSAVSKWGLEGGGTLASIDSSYYGQSVFQTGQLNGQYLHKQNYRGQGKVIAVIDAGFLNVDSFQVFDSLWANHQVLGTRDFVNPGADIFQGNFHGMSVLSIMGGNIPGKLIGTAPKASYWLIRSEDVLSEFIIEEYNWVAAAEFADSVGADIINSSLGYFLFDDTLANYSYSDMDGQTTRVARAANIAASKGMLIVASAGNEGRKTWKYIISPSDGDNVLGVGAVDKYGNAASFTSYGPASDGDIKPNVAAIGAQTVVQNSNGSISGSNGTSYSSPVIAGMAACLWQANPNAKAWQVKTAIEESAHLYYSPDSLLGYGIPDFMVADQILKIWADTSIKEVNCRYFPNPFCEYIVLSNITDNYSGDIQVDFIDLSGRVIKAKTIQAAPYIILDNLSVLPDGIVFLRVRSDEKSEVIKLLKK